MQHWAVRTSTKFYLRFILIIVRSLGFGSVNNDKMLYSNLLSLRLRYNLNLATVYKSLAHSSTGTQSGIYKNMLPSYRL